MRNKGGGRGGGEGGNFYVIGRLTSAARETAAVVFSCAQKGAMAGKLLANLIDGDATARELLRPADPARFSKLSKSNCNTKL